jgi:hypothetical protein
MFSELDFAFLFSFKERIRGPDEVLWYKNSDKKSRETIPWIQIMGLRVDGSWAEWRILKNICIN